MRDEVELYVTFPDGRELLYMTPLGDNQYRLEVTSIGGHLRYGDTIEVGPPLSDGAGSLSTNHQALGGHWEGIVGGVLIVHVPRKLNLDIQQELKGIQQNLE